MNDVSVSSSVIIACFIALLVTALAPVGLSIYVMLKNRGKRGFFFCLLAGVSSFFIMQIIIRLPILSVLSATGVSAKFSSASPLFYLLCLAFTAALFEGAGRFFTIKLMMKGRMSAMGSLAHGIGHGGIECLYVGALTQLSNLFIMLMINSGTLSSALGESAAMNAAVSTLTSVPASEFIISLLERMVVFLFQIALSVMAVYAVRYRKYLWLMVMFALHFLTDFIGPCVLTFSPLAKSTALWVCEGIIFLFTLLAVLLSHRLYRKMRKDDSVSENSSAPHQIIPDLSGMN